MHQVFPIRESVCICSIEIGFENAVKLIILLSFNTDTLEYHINNLRREFHIIHSLSNQQI